jgi:hypothetical protein
MASIKMAKASVTEIDNAIKMAHLTDAVCNCRSYEYPEFPAESDDQLPENFNVDSAADLRKFYDRVSKLSTGLMRVAFGYGVLVDNCCDPMKDVLEFKPGTVTFDEVDRKLLADYKAADAAFKAACVKVDETDAEDPGFDALCDVLNQAADARELAAFAFCKACAAVEV